MRSRGGKAAREQAPKRVTRRHASEPTRKRSVDVIATAEPVERLRADASRRCSDRASGCAPYEVGTDAKIARSSRSPKRRTSTGDACTSPGDLQNMIPRSREVGRRTGARRSAGRTGPRTGRTFADRRTRPRDAVSDRRNRMRRAFDRVDRQRPFSSTGEDRSRRERRERASRRDVVFSGEPNARVVAVVSSERAARRTHLFFPLPLNTSSTAMCAFGTP